MLKDKNLKAIIFGSIIDESYHVMLSDIDMLVISENIPRKAKERAEILSKIDSMIGSFNPFEIHLITPKEYENWYKKFIDKCIEI